MPLPFRLQRYPYCAGVGLLCAMIFVGKAHGWLAPAGALPRPSRCWYFKSRAKPDDDDKEQSSSRDDPHDDDNDKDSSSASASFLSFKDLTDVLGDPYQAGKALRKNLKGPQISYSADDYDRDRFTGLLDFHLEDFRPEVLIVGATGPVGRKLVARLLREGTCRLRVLVSDLYTETLNKLGSPIGVTYCQGTLNDLSSLEYAVTDVDKVVYCSADDSGSMANGMRNLLLAYQNVRFADFGPSQSKATLVKFRSRHPSLQFFLSDKKSHWIPSNAFGHGVFHGQGPSTVVSQKMDSSTLQLDDDANEFSVKGDTGLDLQAAGFGGFLVRLCSNGDSYEFIVVTDDGVEHSSSFQTQTKSRKRNASHNKFTSVRLPFTKFEPPYDGRHTRHIGFRSPARKFYLALHYVKVYRVQPEPEFVYVSDAKVPAANTFVWGDDDDILKQSHMQHYQGEQMLRHSGLSYSIVRVDEYNESPSSELSAIRLQKTNRNVLPVSRSDVAEVCASCLLDANATNIELYVSRSSASTLPTLDEDLNQKIARVVAADD